MEHKKQEAKISNKLESIIKDQGIAVQKAHFHQAVNNGDGIPENYFAAESNVKSRNVNMWWCPIGLVCEHKKKFFVVPTSNVIFADFK